MSIERNPKKNGLINFVTLLAAAVGTFAVSRYAGSYAGQVTAGFLGLGTIVALISWFQMGLVERERIEKLEFDEVTRGGANSSTLFQSADAEAFPVRRSRETFERFFVPTLTVALLLLQGLGGWLIWRWLGKIVGIPTLVQPLMAMSILGLAALIVFLLGQFSSGLARLDGQRLLNPAASQLLLGAYLLGLNIAGLAAVQFEFPRTDIFLARALAAVLILLAIENALTLLLEIYRPRVQGRTTRILYESRLVGLFSHPEGIFTTAAHALDYQFGFKVSDTWFYQFLRRSFGWLVLAQLGILLASTCLVYIEPGEQALLERFGRPVPDRGVLEAGFHAKLPWPIDAIHRYRTQEIQVFDISDEHDEKDEHEEQAVLWAVSHAKDEFHLLVASRDQADLTGITNSAGKKAPPVSLLSVGLPVQYQISDVWSWATNYSNAGDLLRQISTREVVRYLVGVDVNEIMSTTRFAAAEELKKRIQARADELKLGVHILFVGLQDVHPPVEVGEAYERVVGAKQKREADILKAKAYAVHTNAAASSDALRRRLTADGARLRSLASSKANETLFTNQMAAYSASPEVYVQRAYLQTLAQKGGASRKYIVLATNQQEVLFLNVEDKFEADSLLNLSFPGAKP